MALATNAPAAAKASKDVLAIGSLNQPEAKHRHTNSLQVATFLISPEQIDLHPTSKSPLSGA
jgi:hypothetical protein